MQSNEISDTLAATRSRITVEAWDKFHARIDKIGVIHEVPDIARAVIEEAGYTVRETILSKDGQRVWTIDKA